MHKSAFLVIMKRYKKRFHSDLSFAIITSTCRNELILHSFHITFTPKWTRSITAAFNDLLCKLQWLMIDIIHFKHLYILKINFAKNMEIMYQRDLENPNSNDYLYKKVILLTVYIVHKEIWKRGNQKGWKGYICQLRSVNHYCFAVLLKFLLHLPIFGKTFLLIMRS